MGVPKTLLPWQPEQLPHPAGSSRFWIGDSEVQQLEHSLKRFLEARFVSTLKGGRRPLKLASHIAQLLGGREREPACFAQPLMDKQCLLIRVKAAPKRKQSLLGVHDCFTMSPKLSAAIPNSRAGLIGLLTTMILLSAGSVTPELYTRRVTNRASGNDS